MKIRTCSLDDAAAVRAIYAPYVENTTISFEISPPDVSTMRERIAHAMRTHPWLTAEEDGRIIGYAYASPLRTRAAYNWVAELSIYLDASQCGKGQGGTLYAALIDMVQAQGFCTVYGCLVIPNPASERLQEKLGFILVGTWTRCGFKHGKWLDVAWYEKHIAHSEAGPAPVRPFASMDPGLIEGILSRYNHC